MRTETEILEYDIALAWFNGIYTQERAQLSAELQSLDFNRVKNEYGNIYGKCEDIGSGVET